MRTYKNLTGESLEKWFRDLFKNYLRFEQYFESNGQISLKAIDPTQSAGEHLELDGVLLLGKTCIVFEYTNQKQKHKEKIKKFIRNSNLFVNSTYLSLRQKFELFNIPDNDLDDFEEVENWKFVFFNTSDEFENSNTNRKDFPDYPDIQKELYIFRPTQLSYLYQLVNLINKFAKNEFLASINFQPDELGESETIQLDYIKAEGKFITNERVKADIYLTKIRIDKLLQIARVSRYESIPFVLDDDNNENYQRLLIRRKLTDISKNFISNNRSCFPNTITIVLSKDCKEECGKLHIPKKYSSIDVIDGQHRLFAYTKENITERIRQDSEILASAIKFKDNEESKTSKNSAKLFCEINSTQAKVKNNLIYLIKYDVLKDHDHIAIAGKILLECDNAYNKALSNMLLTTSLKKKNRLGLNSIPITTIVDSDLVPFLKGLRTDKKEIGNSQYSKVFGNNRDYYINHYGEFWKIGKQIIEKYFSFIQKHFKYDWEEGCETYMQSSVYYSAFIRFLRYKLFDCSIEFHKIEEELINLRQRVDLVSKPNKTPSFPKNNKVPPVKRGIKNVFEFLKG